MGRARYLIAKYVPDLFRNEPINVGVIAWLDGVVASKFVSERTDGKLDLRTAPSQILSKTNYRQWVLTWKRMIETDSARFSGTSKIIAKADPDFLNALQTSGRGNYILEQGGEIMEDAASGEIGDIVDFLFERLVEDHEEARLSQSAKELRDELLAEGDLNADVRVKSDKMVPCTVGKKKYSQEFHLYIGNGEPLPLAQVLTLTGKPRDIKTKADSFVMRFQSAQNTYDHEIACLALYYSPEDEKNDDIVEDALGELGEIANVINLGAERNRAIEEIRTQANRVHL